MLTGGVGAAALIALPDLVLAGPASAAAARKVSSAATAQSVSSASQHFFIYGLPAAGQHPAASVQAARPPASRSRALPAAAAIAANLAAAPVKSPDLTTLALVTVDTPASGTRLTLTLLDIASATVARQGSLTLPDLPAGTNILATPVFAADSSTVALVLAITVPTSWRLVRKADPRNGSIRSLPAATWRSHHALAYFDRSRGFFAGPFHLADEPSLALSTAAANASDLFLWTTREPQHVSSAKIHPVAAPLSRITAFTMGSGKARFSVPSPAPWPGGEPVVTLPNGDVARLVNGRDLQVCSARTGDVTHVSIAPISATRAKPSALTMQSRPDGTIFITKPGIGRAVVIDPADSFRVTSQISFPIPASSLGAPSSKAVLSAAGDVLYVLGAARSGGLSSYNVATGALMASFSQDQQYAGLYRLPSGTLLAVAAANPRLAFFSPSLSPLGSMDTTLQVSDVF
jgi:hypothetical protein